MHACGGGIYNGFRPCRVKPKKYIYIFFSWFSTACIESCMHDDATINYNILKYSHQLWVKQLQCYIHNKMKSKIYYCNETRILSVEQNIVYNLTVTILSRN